MAPITSNNLSFLLDEIVSGIAFEAFFEEALMMPSLYNVRTSGRRRERLASFGGLDEYQPKISGKEIETDEIDQEFEKDFEHIAYGKQVPVERELLDDQEFGLLEDLGRQLGVMASYTMERKAAQLFLDAFAGATYKSEDGKSICNTAHTNSAGANSQSNKGTAALSLTSIKDTRNAMRKHKNYRGQLRSIRGNALLIAPENEETAWEVVRSTGRPDTANRADNFYKGGFSLFVWDFLSEAFTDGDDNNWFMLDTRALKDNLIWYQRIALEVFGDGNLFAGTRRIGGYFRSSHGVRDWRGIYGHEVAA